MVRRPGYTLIEILMATALALAVMAVTVELFANIGQSVGNARATVQMQGQLRATANRLRSDLESATPWMLPPRRTENNEGYFEIVEGPIGIYPNLPTAYGQDSDNANAADLTLGDFDDKLMFTIRSATEPFVGRCQFSGGTVESQEAEVVWFVRGRTLYRRILLVAPQANAWFPNPQPNAFAKGFYANNDLSVRLENGTIIANSLGDLTKRECRFARGNQYPYDASLWGQLGLPTLRECSHPNWVAGGMAPFAPTPWQKIDMWGRLQPASIDNSGNTTDLWPANEVDPETLTALNYFDPNATRVAEDVILDNVIGFDVRVWDPTAPIVMDSNGNSLVPGDSLYAAMLSGGTVVGYGAYVDLNYAANFAAQYANLSTFSGPGDTRTGLVRTYDTWSYHYEQDGIKQNPNQNLPADAMVNGFDDNGDGMVDDPDEADAPPPYPAALRGLQVRLRVFDPDSRKVREVTVLHDFLPK